MVMESWSRGDCHENREGRDCAQTDRMLALENISKLAMTSSQI
ncbi:hypothetical protein MCHI_003081 [Candidatus Magnetoovum chiemensis]|nr:hypothetical protein MCHI_003081 [Candidatus Magnetoovum chiemensis]